MTQGERIRKLINQRGYRIMDFAEKCGITQPTASRIVNDKAKPSTKLKKEIAKVLGTTIEYLDTGVLPNGMQKLTISDNYTEMMQKIFNVENVVRSITGSEIRHLINIDGQNYERLASTNYSDDAGNKYSEQQIVELISASIAQVQQLVKLNYNGKEYILTESDFNANMLQMYSTIQYCFNAMIQDFPDMSINSPIEEAIKSKNNDV